MKQFTLMFAEKFTLRRYVAAVARKCSKRLTSFHNSH